MDPKPSSMSGPHHEVQSLPNLCAPVSLQPESTPNPLAKEELNLLARLMGSMKTENLPSEEPCFRINLFPADQEEA